MSEPIVYIDRSRIRPGRLEEVRDGVTDLVAFIGEREPQLLYYGFHIDDEALRMTVVAVHPDAASVEYHMDVGAEAFRRFADLIDLEGIEVYGDPTERMLDQLEQKARDLGENGSVQVDGRHAGFSRMTPPAATPAR